MLSVDTANIDEARRWVQQFGVCKMITTNQKIFSTENNINYETRIYELLRFRVPVSIELTGSKEFLKEAKSYCLDNNRQEHSNAVIKVPMWKDGHGLEIAKVLLDNKFKVNMTCLIDINQMILACELGATYASFFYNRMIDWYAKDTSLDDARKITNGNIVTSRRIIDAQGFKTKIICGSIRKPNDAAYCFHSGAHIVTVTPKVLEQMPFHPKTEETIAEFDEAWKEFCAKSKIR